MTALPPIYQDGIVAGRLDSETLSDNFCDVHPALDLHEARVAADRCYFCYDAPCITACPTEIDIPLFIRQIATGTEEAAATTIFDQNILGGMCARVCPTEVLCEESCVRNLHEEKPVEIGLLQRYATDPVIEGDLSMFSRAERTGRTVAVIGAGPAGLSCAHRLAMLGHDVVVFDGNQRPGGLNEYGIAAYKVIDDFAHHPTAIQSTLNALRAASTSGKLIAMIEPRSNTMRLGEHKAHLVACAADADLALWLDPPGLDWDLSHTVASASGQEAFDSVEAMIERGVAAAVTGDSIVVMSNGGFDGLHQRLLTALAER